MKYYVLEIAEGDAKIAGKGVYEYDSVDDAEASFHQKIATAMKSELYIKHICIVVNDEGKTKFSHVFNRKVD